MPKHLKDLENRVHENCGFHMRDLKRVMLPGHIVVPTSAFVDFASYILRGGTYGWQGACPDLTEVTQALQEINSFNLDALTDPAAPVSKAEKAAASTSRSAHPLLTDEAFYAMFREKFAQWKPVPAYMSKLPEPIRKYIDTVQRQVDPEGNALAMTALREENNALQKQVMDYRQKLLAKDKENQGLSEYMDTVEARIDMAEKAKASAERRAAEAEKKLAEAEKTIAAQNTAMRDKDAQIHELRVEGAKTAESLEITKETLRAAEQLLDESEEARLRQEERFCGSEPGSEAPPEHPKKGSSEEAKSPEENQQRPSAPKSGTGSLEDPGYRVE